MDVLHERTCDMDNSHERTCVICLDGPLKDDPLHLIACGCKTAWFHRACQMRWMTNTPVAIQQLKCPTCKRSVPMQYQYAYHASFGEAQQRLQRIFFLISAECLLALSLWGQYKYSTGHDLPETLFIPAHSLLLLHMPNMLHSQYDILNAMKYVICKNGLQVVYLCMYMYRHTGLHPIFTIPNHVQMLIVIGFLHLFAFGIRIAESRFGRRVPLVDPLGPFVIGYDTLYVDTLRAAETPPNTPKRNKSRGSL